MEQEKQKETSAAASAPIKANDKVDFNSLLSSAYPWDNCSVNEAVSRLGDLKRAYDHIANLVLTRQQKSPPKLFCWVWEHKKNGYNDGPIPESVIAQCAKIIPNGKWLFRDDGNMVKKHGIEVREPAVCCSARCADIYSRWRNDQKARRLGAATTVETGMELR